MSAQQPAAKLDWIWNGSTAGPRSRPGPLRLRAPGGEPHLPAPRPIHYCPRPDRRHRHRRPAETSVVAVLTTHLNAPRLANAEDKELAVLQSDEVGFRGQFVAAVVADSPEAAREAAPRHVRVQYHQEPHHAALRADHEDLYKPEKINAGLEPRTPSGRPGRRPGERRRRC